MKRDEPSASSPTIWRSALKRWNELAVSHGRVRATWLLLVMLSEFLRDSTPERRKRRYGDSEFDWDHRVDTTSGTVGSRDRLLGLLYSPYQPTDDRLFREMLDTLQELTSYSCADFTFIDLGSGKGRALLMASNYPFRRIVGIELLPALNTIAERNTREYRNVEQKCFAIEPLCADATVYAFPHGPIVLYLFNPLPEAGLRSVIANLERSLRHEPRKAYVIYHNPIFEGVLGESSAWRKIFSTHQYAIYESR